MRWDKKGGEINIEVNGEMIWLRGGQTGSMQSYTHNSTFILLWRKRGSVQRFPITLKLCSLNVLSLSQSQKQYSVLFSAMWSCAELSVRWQWKTKGHISWFRCVCTTEEEISFGCKYSGKEQRFLLQTEPQQCFCCSLPAFHLSFIVCIFFSQTATTLYFSSSCRCLSPVHLQKLCNNAVRDIVFIAKVSLPSHLPLLNVSV